jgi:hypothetical protein
MQSAGQIWCTGGKELQPDLAGLDELGNVLPKKRVCRRQPSKPQPGRSETSIVGEAIRRFERVLKISRGKFNNHIAARVVYAFSGGKPGAEIRKNACAIR